MSSSVQAEPAVAEVIVYGTARCPYCVRARSLLESKGIDYQDIRLEEHPERRQEMERLSKRRTVPQIFIDGVHIGGCDELYELEYAGELDSALHIT
ncbi:MAG: glutaredoxin 3 [Gammaproteobacteria bacterium]|nr:glutaredoxin 3 [Gammaproteobacteria bacterium]